MQWKNEITVRMNSCCIWGESVCDPAAVKQAEKTKAIRVASYLWLFVCYVFVYSVSMGGVFVRSVSI